MKSLKTTSANTQLSGLNDANESLNLGGGIQEADSQSIPWNCFFYKMWWHFRRLFSNPFKEKEKELRLLEQVNIILSEGDAKKVADTCEKYISLHRIVENTRARRRLEKWVTRLITIYLAIVFSFVLLGSLSKWMANNNWPYISIDNKVIIALLTTTTVNIVALGIILVRGLYHEHEKKDLRNEGTLCENRE